ncbi:hypothetical protein HY408_01785 [Candidatus Gottesmanbacteria bacterium]|nr:hypothetical protein [Candidatus Gottesmanbacteria bacterium]
MEKPKTSQSGVQVNVNPDTTPILYTDRVFISVNTYGLTFDVTQKVGSGARIVARIGMSREHAKHFTQELGKLLLITEQPAPKGKSKN